MPGVTAPAEWAARVTVSIVTHNSARPILPCLAQLPAGLALRVFDNASTDGTPELLAAQVPDVQLRCASRNQGFGRGHNANLAGCATDYALILNPDCLIGASALQALVQYLDTHPQCALAGPALNARDRQPGAPEPVFLSGACLLLRMAHLGSEPPFDPALFLFFEDVDLCRRLRTAGYQITLLREVQALHAVAQSCAPDWRLRLRRDFHLGWSEAYFKQKYRAQRSPARVLAGVLSRHLRKTLQRLLRLTPRTLEPLLRTLGVLAYMLGWRPFRDV